MLFMITILLFKRRWRGVQKKVVYYTIYNESLAYA